MAVGFPLCPMAGVLGIPCPGCGLTRATLALLRGDFRSALSLHPLVFVLAPLFSWAMGSALVGYVRGPVQRGAQNPWFASRSATALATGLLVLTLGVWGARFCGYFGGPVHVETYASWTSTRALGRSSGNSARRAQAHPVSPRLGSAGQSDNAAIVQAPHSPD